MKPRLHLLLTIALAMSCGSIAAETLTKALLETYMHSFGHPATGLLYHNRLDGPKGVAVLSSPEEIARGEVRGKPLAYGYGSGIQDIALENGQVLFALCEIHEVTGDTDYAEKARALFKAMQALALISPEPGFVPRGPHPDGKSYYPNSSRDQHAAYIEALWRYGRSPLATGADKRFIADTLGKIAARMERNDWRIMVEDNSEQAHVGFTWKQFTTTGAISLLSALAMVADATDDPHWRAEYERFSAEKDGERWSKWLHPDALGSGQPLTLYANQFSQALTALRRCEKDVNRQKQIAEFQRQWAVRALESNVFDTGQWRRLDWAGDRDEAATRAQVAALGLDLEKPMTVLDLYDAYDRKVWEQPATEAFRTMHKLCFGLTTVALHGSLLAEDPELTNRVKPTVDRMTREFSEHHAAYHGGENFNRIVILGLLAEARSQSTAGADYGRELPIASSVGNGPVIDVTVEGSRAYAIGEGTLFIMDVSEPSTPRVLGKLDGLGSVRQIVVGRDVAYVSSRQDGLFVVNVADPASPALLCHYDTIEWATGLALSGDVLFVACRHFGVELVDVSTPESPAHLSTVRTGEAQSVVARNGWLYAGVWGSSEIVTADVRNPRSPVITSRVPLDGYGDGVDVRGNFLYAATGHHSRLPHRSEREPGFGTGHGLEVFDVTDPAQPVFVSRLKFPKFYFIGNDMWSVTAAGDFAFVADTYNGVFVVDVRDPRQLRCVAHRRPAYLDSRESPDFVGGLAIVKDHVYAAGGWTDLHVLDATGLTPAPVIEPDAAPAIPPPTPPEESGFRTYKPGGQVYAAAMLGEHVVAACGSGGIHLLQLQPEIKALVVQPTPDVATDVCVLNDLVYVAEGTEGLSIWSTSEPDGLKRIGRYQVPKKRVRHVTVPAPGRYALVEVGSSTLHIVDVSNPSAPSLVLEDHPHGLLYGNQIMDGLIEDRYVSVFWHVSGLHWYDLYGGPSPVALGRKQSGRFSPREGVIVLDGKALTTRRGGYVIFDHDDPQSLDDAPVLRAEKTTIHGKPTFDAGRLYVADRASGEIHILDLTDPSAPKSLDSFTTTGHPGRIVPTPTGFLIPDGYEGLRIYDRRP